MVNLDNLDDSSLWCPLFGRVPQEGWDEVGSSDTLKFELVSISSQMGTSNDTGRDWGSWFSLMIFPWLVGDCLSLGVEVNNDTCSFSCSWLPVTSILSVMESFKGVEVTLSDIRCSNSAWPLSSKSRLNLKEHSLFPVETWSEHSILSEFLLMFFLQNQVELFLLSRLVETPA